jgi:hypothetical protein
MATLAEYNRPTRPAYSAPAIVAVVCAIGSFFAGAGLGLLLAVLAIVAGLIGIVMALSPSVRGGIVSTVSVLAGVVGILAAVVKLFVH